MQKTFILLLTLLLLSNTELTANDNTLFEKNRLNIYANGLYFDYGYTTTTYNNGYQSKDHFNTYDFGFLSFAIEKKLANHFYREFEWLPIRFKYQSSAYYIIDTRDNSSIIIRGEAFNFLESALRYQINYYPFANNERKVNPYLGLSSRLNLESYVQEPKVANFKTAQRAIGLGIQLSPGFEYKISSTASFVFDLPLTFFSLKFKVRRVDNPTIPLEQQRNYSIDQEFFPKGVNFRLGLKMNLAKG